MKNLGFTAFLTKLPTLFALAVLAGAGPAFAGGTVTNLTQADLQTALAGGGTVLFGVSGTLPLTNTIAIAQDTVLDTHGFAVTISGGGAVRLFQVATNVTFAVNGLTLADGRFVGANGADGDPPAPGQDGSGAGLLNLGGTVNLTGCTLTNHFVQGGNGGVSSNLPPQGRGGDGLGAAICSMGGWVNLTNSLLIGNAATGGSGGAFSGPFGDSTGDSGGARGGAIFTAGGSVNLQNVTLASNSVSGGSFQGYGGSYGRSGSGLGGALFISQDASGFVESSSFSGNSAASGTGASGCGGAAFVAGAVQVLDSTFSSNNTKGGDGSPVGAAGQGGAICSTNSLAVTACTFDHNLALGGAGFTVGRPGFLAPGGPGEGGAIWSSGLLTVTNCTLVVNQAVGGLGESYSPPGPGPGSSAPPGSAQGGAICVAGGPGTLVNVTIAANRADGVTSNGGGLSSSNSAVTVRNSIIANSANGGDVWGSLTDAGYNLCSDNTAHFSAAGSLNNTDPLLSALSNNGGPTATLSLLVGSPARDAIPSGFPPTDQRGVARPQGPAADIGAVEADFVASPPAIVTPPQSAAVRAGAGVTFTVAASGTPPLFYQWQKNGTPIPGATSNSLSLTDVTAADAGIYSVVVSNAVSSTPSQSAVLTVDSTPLIVFQPQSVLVSPGAGTNFTVTAEGPLLAYQWWHDWQSVPGATAPTLPISNALAGAQGSYFVVVSNFAGTATSAVATLSFDASALNILASPHDQTVEAGYAATFSVLVSGIPPVAYQWTFNGASLAGATNSSLTLPAVRTNDAGWYRVIVANGYGTVLSPRARLTVTPGAVSPALWAGLVANNLTITFAAEAGRSYRLLSSPDLAAWTPVATNAAVAAGPLQFVRPIPSAPNVFYRVVTP